MPKLPDCLTSSRVHVLLSITTAMRGGVNSTGIDQAGQEKFLQLLDELKKQFDADGAVVVRMSPTTFTEFFKSELEKWGRVVKESNIKAE